MKNTPFRLAAALMLMTQGLLGAGAGTAGSFPDVAVGNCDCLSPTALVASPDGRTLFIACSTARRILVLDLAAKQVRRGIEVPHPPLGLALSRDGSRLYAACAAPSSAVCVIDTLTGSIMARIPVGHTAMAPVLSPDGNTLYVCNRFNDNISVVDLAAGREAQRIAVSREPVAAALTPEGKLLLVANHLYSRKGDGPGIAATVSVIDTCAGRVVKQIQLPRGSSVLRGIAVSPDGRLAAVTHLMARYYLPAKDLVSGGINCNAVSLLDLQRLELRRFVSLDQPGRGAANPWAVAWTPDNKALVVTHAGTHAVSLIDGPILPQKPARIRERIALPGNGPRALAVAGSRVYVGNYFSENVSVIDLAAPHPCAESIELAPAREPSRARQGEMLFNDGTLCRQGWQSCASCHDPDGRTDGHHWDLLNDGTNNAKSTKSLLWAHRTPPSMAMGVRANAEAAVRAGLRHILFSEQPEDVAAAIDEFLQSLEPVPSPHLINGRRSAAAERGQQVFRRADVGCVRCHSPPLFTDCRMHDVGTRGPFDRPGDRFDTPTLVELWRTPSYLHDDSAGAIETVLTKKNPHDQHGRTSHLTREEINDLAEYLLSL